MNANKKTISIIFMMFLLTGGFSCKDKVLETRKFTGNKPVYLSYEDMRNGVKFLPGEDLKQTGKMYFYNDYVFVNEYLKGIHIIDNSDPSNPQNIKFIEIPGNIDMVIKDNFLYVDSYVDLVVLNIADINNIVEINRIEDVFPYQVPEYDYTYPLATIDTEAGVVVGYTIEEIEETYETNGGNWNFRFYKYETLDVQTANSSSNYSGGGQGIGIAGSMARFSIYEDNMYLLNETILNVYDISNLRMPTYVTELNTTTIAETLFLYNGKLFMGTQTGMRVYDLSNPDAPVFVSEFSHIQSCDPVVVDSNYAYVTLRSGNACGSFTNQLDVVDISVITSPELVKSYELTNPHGLGIQSDKTLFVCDGEAGLKVYDASDPLRIDENILFHFPEMDAFDVIPLGNLIMMISEDGLYQYNFEGGVMTQLSFIPIGE
ncbi:MAG: hypothetical protein L3J35_01990 [Bacteroidales bacterium]|nr:hypothetical protein [Bacteroidales bacterium]